MDIEIDEEPKKRRGTRKSPRTAQMTIKLDPKIIQGLSQISASIGIPTTTLASVALGEYVSRGLTALGGQGRMQELLVKELGSSFAPLFAALEQSMKLEDKE